MPPGRREYQESAAVLFARRQSKLTRPRASRRRECEYKCFERARYVSFFIDEIITDGLAVMTPFMTWPGASLGELGQRASVEGCRNNPTEPAQRKAFRA